MNNDILREYNKDECTFEDIHSAIYCGAVAVTRMIGLRVKDQRVLEKKKMNKQPKWEQRLVKKIEELRKNIGRLHQYKAGNRSKKLMKHCQNIFVAFQMHTRHEKFNEQVIEFLDTLKQKLCALSKRLQRYRECTDKKKQNQQFLGNEKKFYRQLNENGNNNGNGNPSKDEITEFWSGIWSQPLEHNRDAEWIRAENRKMEKVTEMEFVNISTQELSTVIKSSRNWNAPGVDNIHNFWYKKFSSLHEQLAIKLSELVRGDKMVPQFLTEGITLLKPKDGDTKNPAKYRPITCLPTIYKFLTSCIANKIYTHCDENTILAEEQKGCRKNSQGSKEQLIIDAVVMNQVHSKKRNIYTTFIDYKKAYDSVPHSWLIHVLEIYKINTTIVTFLKNMMDTWKTKMHLNTKNTRIVSDTVKISRGIFQGDALSPLWFCLAINPLSNILNTSKSGFKIKDGSNVRHTISHLLYMDDIKLYAATKSQMQSLVSSTEKFSEDICMEFGIDKCKTLNVNKGKIRQFEGFQLENNDVIDAMEDGEVYKYLGFAQSSRIQHSDMKVKLKSVFVKRMVSILKTKLNAKNKVKAINTYAVPILTYSFGIIKWTQTDITDLQRLIRTTFTKFRMHHPKAAIERITISRNNGGRGIIDLNNLYYKQIDTLRKYFYSKRADSSLHQAIVSADKQLTPLHLDNNNLNPENNINAEASKEHSWSQKVLHGRHYKGMNDKYIDKQASNKWLQVGDLFSETEGFIVAIQDKVISTKNYRKHIVKDGSIEDKCRKCHMTSETIEHIVSGCPLLAQTYYLHRHNQIANIIHQKLAIKYKLLQESTPYYKYKPQAVLDNQNYKLYYDRAVITDQTIHHNRPDIILMDKKSKHTYLIDIAVPSCVNLEKTWEAKLSKYYELSQEVKKMWKQARVSIIPLVISGIGLIPRKLHDSIKQLELPANTYIEMQKAVIINTCSIVRKFLNSEAH